MQKLVWINSKGTEINLTSGDYGITEWVGFSACDVEVQTQNVPFQDGSVFLDALLNNRELSVTLAINDDKNLEKRYRLRRELIAALNPKLGEGYLIYTNDFISKRIKCLAQMPVFPTHNSDKAGTPKASLSWTACDPYWEDVEETLVTFPIDEKPVIKNNGDVPCQMKIEFITNSVTNPKVENLTTEKFIQYKGELNNVLSINTNIGNKEMIGKVLTKKNISSRGAYNAIIYNSESDLYMMTTSLGEVVTTKDFKNFNYIFISNRSINAIAYSKNLGLYVAGGDRYRYTSTDGVNWNAVNINFNIYGIAYSESLGIFIQVGDRKNNHIMKSSDGINWTDVAVSTSYLYNFTNVQWFEEISLFIIANRGQGTFTSSDGINWTEHRFEHVTDAITYCKTENQLYMIARNYTLTSSDGINWTEHENNLPRTSFKNLVCCNDIFPHKFIFIATDTTNYYDSEVFFSYDGFIFEQGVSNAKQINALIYAQNIGEFIGVGAQSSVLLSSDAINFEYANPNQFNFLNHHVIYVEKYKMYVSAGSGGLQTSVDGENWIRRDINSFTYVMYCDELDLFIGSRDNGLYLSRDCITWNQVLSVNYKFSKIIYIAKLKLFCAISNTPYLKAILYTSSDGINWTERINNDLQLLNDIYYCEKLNTIFTVGGVIDDESLRYIAGLIYASNDGINWTERTNDSQTSLNSITYGKYSKVLVIVGGDIFTTEDKGIVLTSSDGVNWYRQNIPSMLFHKVIYGGIENIFVAVGNFDYSNYGKIFISHNGYNWNEVYSIENCAFYDVCYSENMNMFVAVGSGILVSYNGHNWNDMLGNNNADLDEVIFSEHLLEFLIMGGSLIKLIFQKKNNLIQNISNDSNMNLNLEVGDNKMKISKDSGFLTCNILYRQKYIGV